jgi:hypothetical protein
LVDNEGEQMNGNSNNEGETRNTECRISEDDREVIGQVELALGELIAASNGMRGTIFDILKRNGVAEGDMKDAIDLMNMLEVALTETSRVVSGVLGHTPRAIVEFEPFDPTSNVIKLPVRD